MNFEHVRSADGLALGFARIGVGPPLIIVHGGLTIAEDWLPVAEELRNEYTVYLLERRGRSHSCDSGRPYAFQREIEDAAALIGLVGGKVALFGHSFGGAVLLGYAIQTGFDGDLILYEAGHSIAGTFSGKFLPEVIAYLEAGVPEKALASVYASLGGAPMADEVARLRNTARWQTQVSLMAGLVREISALETFAPTAEDCKTINASVTLLLGSETSYSDATRWASPLVGRIRGLTVLSVNGQAHNAHLYDPRGLARVILKALRLRAL